MTINRRRLFQGLAVAGIATPALSEAQKSLNDRLSGSLSPVHDPCLIKADGVYHLFSTSQAHEKPGLIHWRTSTDLLNWQFKGAVMSELPAWVNDELPGTRGAWAPDIIYAEGQYRLYYSLSQFGKNTSRIALLTTPTLDSTRADFGWVDQGIVVRSDTKNDHNAIDSHYFIDTDGRHWLSWGSFWTGIKLAELNPATGKLLNEKARPKSIARRSRPGAIEAPVIHKRGDSYYLFASNDFCCRGVDSSYYTIVGRASKVDGPYVDAEGKRLTNDGGQIVLHAQLDKSGRFKGPGHCDIYSEDGRDFIVYHAYDAQNGGRPTLRLNELKWTADGWPVAV